MKSIRIGIDLGTTSTLVATLDAHRQPELLVNRSEGNRFVTPSVIHVDGRKAYVGQSAIELIKYNPNIRLIQFFKRYFGKDDPLYFDSDGNGWYPEGLAALLLKKIMFDVQMLGHESIEGAVITVPAHFDEKQKKTVLDAATLANLEVLDLIEEPLAAALHYGLQRNGTEENILVYDLGGGTFDVTVISTQEELAVLAKEGITDLGGKEFDDCMKAIIIRQFEEITGMPFAFDSPFDLQVLANLSEEFKKNLSIPGKKTLTEVVTLNGQTVEMTIRLADFEQAIEPLVQRSIEICQSCLRSINLPEHKINRVLLVGGSTFIPLIKRSLEQIFNAPWQQVLFHEPLRAVAYGAALYAHRLDSARNYKGKLLGNLSEYHYGIRTYDGEQRKMTLVPILGKNQSIPMSNSAAFYKTRSEQERLRFEVSRFRENTLKPELSQIEVLGELEVGGLVDKPVHQRIDLRLELATNGTLYAEARDPLSPWAEKAAFESERVAKPYLTAQHDLLRQVGIVGQV